MKCALMGASILMATLTAIGIGITFTTGGNLDGHLVAYGAGMIAFGAAWVMVIGIGALAVNLAVLRHQRSIEKNLIVRLQAHERQRKAAEQILLVRINELAEMVTAGIEAINSRLQKNTTAFDGRLDTIEDQHERLERLMSHVSTNQEREATILGNVIEGKVRKLPAR